MTNSNQVINLLKNIAGNNSIMNNALQMLQNGNSKGIEQLARNLCKSKGINPDEAFNKIKQQYMTR